MRMFRVALVLAAGAAMLAPLSQLASAADLGGSGGYKDTPYVAVPWQGFYFGGHGGGAWGNTNVHDKFDYVGDPQHSFSGDSTSFIGGAQAGYNIQRGHVVFGLEGDIGYLNISAKSTAKDLTTPNGKCTGYYTAGTPKVDYEGEMCRVDANYATSSDLYGDLTARLGYAADRTLFYVKGGGALLNANLKAHYAGGNCLTDGKCSPAAGATVAPSPFDTDHSETMVGWTIGAGVEYALSPAWSLKAEYQHFDFGSISYSYNFAPYNIPCAGCNHDGGHYTSTITNGKTDISVTADAVKLGLNYRVGGR